jgi:hypothetical protein
MSSDARLVLLRWVEADDWVPLVSGRREGRGNCRYANWAEGVTLAHAGKRRREGRWWATLVDQKGRGEENEFEMAFQL